MTQIYIQNKVERTHNQSSNYYSNVGKLVLGEKNKLNRYEHNFPFWMTTSK